MASCQDTRTLALLVDWVREGEVVVKIAKEALDAIHAHAEATYPEECCGLLVSEAGKRVTEAIRMKNSYSGPKHDRYYIDPLELFSVDREVARRGLTIAGIYHSHPDYPATLSKFDLEHSFPWYSYVVVSVLKGEAKETKSWIASHDGSSVREESIEVTED